MFGFSPKFSGPKLPMLTYSHSEPYIFSMRFSRATKYKTPFSICLE